MKNRALVLAVTAGAAVCSSALAVDLDVVVTNPTNMLDEMGPRINVDGTLATSRPFAGRVPGVTYDCGAAPNAYSGSVTLGTASIMDDFDFGGGPWAAAATRSMTDFTWNVVSASGTDCPEGSQRAFNFKTDWFAFSDVNYESANMLDPDADTVLAVPFYSVTIGTGAAPVLQSCPAAGFAITTWRQTDLTAAGANPAVSIPSSKVAVRMRIVQPGTSTLFPYTSAGTGALQLGLRQVTPISPHNVGTHTAGYARDLNGNAADLPAGPSGLEGGTPIITGAGAGAHEYRQASSTVMSSYSAAIEGDITCGASPTLDANLNTLPDGVTSATVNVGAGQVRWIGFAINNDANQANGTFLDIDTEGSLLADPEMTLYSATGATLKADDDDGSLLNSQLSFGRCRRAPVGDGRDYDGQDGTLNAIDGPFFLAVAEAGGSYGDCWIASSVGTGSGDVTVNFNTNTNSGTGGPAAVAPTIGLLDDLGDVSTAGSYGPLTPTIGTTVVHWSKFTTGAVADPTNFLDIDVAASGPSFDTFLALYTDTGAKVAENDDVNGTDIRPQLSFGAMSPPRAYGTMPNATGQTGALAAGTYYVAFTLFPATAATTDWCVQSTSGSSIIASLTVVTGAGGTAGCFGACVADFDDGSFTGTPDGGVTVDDLLYYLSIFDAGDVCADVDDGSGTNTLDGGVTIDDLLYYLFRFDAGC